MLSQYDPGGLSGDRESEANWDSPAGSLSSQPEGSGGSSEEDGRPCFQQAEVQALLTCDLRQATIWAPLVPQQKSEFLQLGLHPGPCPGGSASVSPT